MKERTRLNREIKRNLRDTSNPLYQKMFIKQYRFRQTIAFRLIDEIRPFVANIGDIPLEIQVSLCVEVLRIGCISNIIIQMNQLPFLIFDFHFIIIFLLFFFSIVVLEPMRSMH